MNIEELEKMRKAKPRHTPFGCLIMLLLLCIPGFFVYAFLKTAKYDVVEKACKGDIYRYASQNSLSGTVSLHSRGKYRGKRLISTYGAFSGGRGNKKTNFAYFDIIPSGYQKGHLIYMGICKYDPWRKSTAIEIKGSRETQ